MLLALAILAVNRFICDFIAGCVERQQDKPFHVTYSIHLYLFPFHPLPFASTCEPNQSQWWMIVLCNVQRIPLLPLLSILVAPRLGFVRDRQQPSTLQTKIWNSENQFYKRFYCLLKPLWLARLMCRVMRNLRITFHRRENEAINRFHSHHLFWISCEYINWLMPFQ